MSFPLFRPDPDDKHPAPKADPKQTFAGLLVEIARSQIGTRETGNNTGPVIRRYQAATWLPPGPWPWCAAFVCWCVQQALEAAPARGITVPPQFRRPTTAGAYDFENWATDRHPETGKPLRRSGGPEAGVTMVRRPTVRDLRPGDIVTFLPMSHIGIVSGPASDGYLMTIEGNTNAAGSREGDGVWGKKRPTSWIRARIRLEF